MKHYFIHPTVALGRRGKPYQVPQQDLKSLVVQAQQIPIPFRGRPSKATRFLLLFSNEKVEKQFK